MTKNGNQHRQYFIYYAILEYLHYWLTITAYYTLLMLESDERFQHHSRQVGNSDRRKMAHFVVDHSTCYCNVTKKILTTHKHPFLTVMECIGTQQYFATCFREEQSLASKEFTKSLSRPFLRNSNSRRKRSCGSTSSPVKSRLAHPILKKFVSITLEIHLTIQQKSEISSHFV